MNKEVSVTCYGVTKSFSSIQEAKDTFLEAMFHSDGSESERYLNIIIQLEQGLTICSDNAQLIRR